MKPGQICGQSVKIRLDKIGNEIEAEVISVDPGWQKRPRYMLMDGFPTNNFEEGMRLILVRKDDGAGNYWWIVEEPYGLPWFVLRADGEFEFYR